MAGKKSNLAGMWQGKRHTPNPPKNCDDGHISLSVAHAKENIYLTKK
ncbi:MAG: hypothetical protein IKA80_08880 [Spirochaetaceae bacterium]|nr:hypothetical protein [Spirochaetaceae bacterium]MBQ8561464.1 hypothetical protein [Spirochaetaceae bacterium]MBR2362745.1 hypothetical protein [Spirochaetaceae bacterium]